jgi:CRP/FNR family cyclic AMP-dependent transcriptional regulator
MRHPFSPRRAVFASLGNKESERLDAAGSSREYPAGVELYRQDELPVFLYRVLRGRLNIFSESSEARRLIVRVAFPGDMLGMGANIASHPYVHSAITTTPARIQSIPRDEFLAMMESVPHFSECVSLSLANEYLDMVEIARIMQLAGGTTERIISVLITLADEADMARPFHSFLSHGEIADMAGCARESVSRVMQTLERERKIRVVESTITLLRPDQLLAVCGSLRGGFAAPVAEPPVMRTGSSNSRISASLKSCLSRARSNRERRVAIDSLTRSAARA